MARFCNAAVDVASTKFEGAVLRLCFKVSVTPNFTLVEKLYSKVLLHTTKYWKGLLGTAKRYSFLYKVLLCTTEYNDNAAAHPKT